MNSNKLTYIFRFMLLIIGSFSVYYFGDNPNDHKNLVTLFSSAILLFIFYVIGMQIIRKIIRNTSSMWVRDELSGALNRANKLALGVMKTIFWSYWWITSLLFFLMYPLASALGTVLILQVYLISFLIIDFSTRQISLNWFWKNREDHMWKYNIKDQLISIFKHLVLSPLIIILLHIYDVSIYEVEENILEGRDGWLWYVFSVLGVGAILLPIAYFLRSIFDPEDSITQLTEDTYEDGNPPFETH